MKPKAILFDLDDTIIDRKSTLKRYAERMGEGYKSVLHNVSRAKLSSIIIEQDNGGYKPKDEFFADLLKIIPWGKSVEFNELRAHWYQHYPSSSTVDDTVYEVFDQLTKQGVILGVVTNGTSPMQNAKIDLIGIRQWMETIIISEEAGLKKPDQRIFEKALQEIRVSANYAWFVGDHPLNDIIGSATAGMTPVWLRGKHPWLKDEPEPRLQMDDWKQFMKLFESESE